jgi:hypothetical protein
MCYNIVFRGFLFRNIVIEQQEGANDTRSKSMRRRQKTRFRI